MKFSCSRSTLAEALHIINNVIPSRSTKPILQNVQIKGNNNNTITLTGTDLEIGISMILDIEEIIDPETVLVSAHTLQGIIAEDKSEFLNFDIREDVAIMMTSRGEFNFSIAIDDDFPKISELGEENIIEIPGDALTDAIAKTEFATAKGDTRYALNGICMNILNDSVDFVASDTHRLSKVNKKINNINMTEGKYIIITKGMKELGKLSAGEEIVKIQLYNNELIAKTSNATIVTRLVEGQFPNYNNVIPADSSVEIQLNREEIMNGLRLVGKMSNEESHSVKFDAANNKLSLSATTGNVGSGTQEYEVNINGGEIKTNFNYNYMIDALKSFNNSELNLIFKDNDTPVKIIEGDYLHIVMPITTK